MDELWGATGATHTHCVKIVSMHEGLGNNIRGFAGMVGLAMVTGRGLSLACDLSRTAVLIAGGGPAKFKLVKTTENRHQD
jgi:hypothetical protein